MSLLHRTSPTPPGGVALTLAATALAAVLSLAALPTPVGAGALPQEVPQAAPQTGSPAAGTGELSIADVAALARPSVVDILLPDGSGGSGVRIGAGVITNAHVVGNAKEVALTLHDGTRVGATVVRADDGYDLALLRTDADFPALELEPAGAQRQGDTVLVLAYPALGDTALSRGVTLSRGIIAAVRVDEDSGATLIQTDAALNAGSSGGALLNLRGRLVGIPSFSLGDSPGLGFAVAADTVQAFLDGQPSRQPAARNLAAFLVSPADLGPNYAGRVAPSGPRDREAYAFADSPTGPAVVQLLLDAGSPERAAQEVATAAAAAEEDGATELRMAVTAGKRVFVRYTEDAEEMGVVVGKGPYVVTVFLDFAGLPDTGDRADLAVRIADMILARL